jgi:endoglucanase
MRFYGILYLLFSWGMIRCLGLGGQLRGNNDNVFRTRWYIENKEIMLEERGVQLSRAIALKGINWPGLDTDALAPFGMWKHSQEFFLDQLRAQKFNAIRVLFSAEWAYYHWDATPNPSMIYNDIEARNKTSLQILDMLMEKTQRKNIVIILAMGRLHKDFLTDIWVHYPEYPTSVFMESWFRLLDRYHLCPHLMGIDLFNEPHGVATMSGDTEDPYDWITMIINTIDAVETRYPSNSWLYFIQGIPWGAGYNTTLVDAVLVKPYANRVVYTPHIIDRQDPDLYQVKTPVRKMFDTWDQEFGFVSDQYHQMVMITRCNSVSTIWTGLLGDYALQNQMTNIFLWELSTDPNEGIFQEDWNAFRPDRIMILEMIQPNVTRTILQNR